MKKTPIIPFRKIVTIVDILIAITFFCGCSTSFTVDMQYGKTVSGVVDIYKECDPDTDEGRKAAWRHLAFQSGYVAAWDFDYMHKEIVSDKQYLLELYNYGKLWEQKTKIIIKKKKHDKTKITIDTWEKTHFDLFRRRNLSWQNERKGEIGGFLFRGTTKYKKRKIKKSKQELYRTIIRDDWDLVKEMIHAGLNINTKDQAGRTPLMYACTRDTPELVEYLLEHGADVNVRSDQDNTSLHRAVMAGNLKIIKILLEHGANINARNGYNETPLSEAKSQNMKEIADLLIRQGAKE